MRIAVWHNLPSGGGKRALYYHVRGLVERGHEVECWSLDSADHSYLPLTEFAPEHILPLRKTAQRERSSLGWSKSYNEDLERMRANDEGCKRCAREIEARQLRCAFRQQCIALSHALHHATRTHAERVVPPGTEPILV